MTRMWLVPSRIMCRSHLMGEHAEMHQVVGTITNHQHSTEVIEGHVHEDKPDDVDTTFIRLRHSELAREMERRGYNHDSELPDFDDPHVGNLDDDDIQVNKDELALKCNDCRIRRVLFE